MSPEKGPAPGLEPPAILLIAHGSRQPKANADTIHFAQEMVRRGPFQIAVAAFLELARPDIDMGAAECVARGARRVVLLPHFLTEGVHVQRDLTAALDRLRHRHPGVTFSLAAPLGRHPAVLEALLDRAQSASE